MPAERYFLLAGGCLLLAVVLPTALRRFAVSPAMVLLLVGVVIGLTPLSDGLVVDVTDTEGELLLVEHVTEVTVLTALMGVGLAIDRPLHLLRLQSWRRWSPTWRLLGVTLPLSVAAVALLGWWGLGLAPATALLLGAVLSPTDPVLASDVQVGGPGSSIADGTPEEVPVGTDPTTSTEQGEVRFALTSEAGLNDGLAFPFVHVALVALAGFSTAGVVELVAWDFLGRVAVGVLAGVVVGRVLGVLAFRSRRPSLRLAEQGEPLLALAALLTTYGLAEVLHGYGFVAVFACGMALRAAEHRADYHRAMHEVVSRLERLLTLLVLLVLGIAFSGGLLVDLDWRGVLVGVALVLVIRPLAGLAGLGVRPRTDGEAGGLGSRARLAVAFFGVRGVGSIYYLAWATREEQFEDVAWLWSTVAFTIALSVVVHGVAATPLMRRLEDRPGAGPEVEPRPEPAQPQPAQP